VFGDTAGTDTVGDDGVPDGDGVGGLTTLLVTGTTKLNSTTVTSTGSQTYDDVVTLGANVNLTATTVSFLEGVTGGSHALTVTGNAVFGDTAGTDTVGDDGAPDGDGVGGLTTLLVTGTTNLNGTTVSSTGTQTYDDVVTLGANVTFPATTVSFLEGVTGASDALTFTGNAVFGDTAGTDTVGDDGAPDGDGVGGLTTLLVTGTTSLNSTTVSSTGTQTYDDVVTLGANVTFPATTVSFLEGVTGGGHALTVTGNAVFGDTAGTDTVGDDGVPDGDGVGGLTTLLVTGTTSL